MLINKAENYQIGSLCLRGLSELDISTSYVSWLNDPEVNRFLESRFSVQTAESVLAFVNKCNQNSDVVLLGIFINVNDCNDSMHIGNVKIGPIQINHGTAEVGILIGDKNYWGKGLGEKVITAVCQIAKINLGIRKLTAGCYGKNIGSYKAFTRAGFICVGERKNHVVSQGGLDSIFVFDKEL